MGLDQGGHGPHVLGKIVYAGVHNTSFAAGSQDLRVLAGLKVPEKQGERLTKSIGRERVAQRDRQVEAFLALPLMEKVASPPVRPPDVAVVSMDRGRLQIRAGSSPAAAGPTAATPSDASPPESSGGAPQADAGPDPEQDQDPSRWGHWRDDKIGLLMTMTGTMSRDDPCPTIPETFVNPLRSPKLVREIKRSGPARGAGVVEDPEDDAAGAVGGCPEYTPPEVRVKTMVGSRVEAKRFGAVVAAAAFARGFLGASRKAFVADGAEANWGVHRQWFRDFVAILDFIHALSYVFSAAMAGQSFRAGWEVDERWITRVWQGRVGEVIAALKQRQKELGPPMAGDSETSPRQVVADALRYRENNAARRKYDESRRQGLPLVSSQVESTVKRFNRRLKGTEKFWSEPGAEALLQLRGDYLRETDPMEKYWQEREDGATGRRRYRRTA